MVQKGKKKHSKEKSKADSSNVEKVPVKTKKNKILIFLWNVVFYVVMISIFLGAGLMAIMQQQDKSLMGYRVFGVLTDSMVSPDNTVKKGGFRSGDVVINKEIEGKDIKKGDVITYRPSLNPKNKSNTYLTHRVVKVQDGWDNEKGIFITTRGDANNTDDMPVSEKAVVGKIVGRIPKVGSVLKFIKENLVMSILFVVSVAGFIWFMRKYFSSDEVEASTKETIKKAEALPEDKKKKSKKKNSSKSKSKSSKKSKSKSKSVSDDDSKKKSSSKRKKSKGKSNGSESKSKSKNKKSSGKSSKKRNHSK